MSTKEKVHKKNEEENNENKGNDMFLILHNDDVNTFEYVIETLVELCKHDAVQAEQCAFITHFKGKCDVKKGKETFLKTLHKKFRMKGLITTIEN